MRSSELAENDGDNEQHQDGYNGNGNDAVRGHPAVEISLATLGCENQKGIHLGLPINQGF